MARAIAAFERVGRGFRQVPVAVLAIEHRGRPPVERDSLLVEGARGFVGAESQLVFRSLAQPRHLGIGIGQRSQLVALP